MSVLSAFRLPGRKSVSGATPHKTRRIRRVVMVAAAAIGSVAGAAVLAQPASAVGVNLFVSTTGSNGGSNNCQTAGSPCATLAYTLTQAVASDTIMMAPGTYTLAAGSSNTVPTALTGLTIESNGGTAANTIINGAGGINGLAINANNVTVNNLTIENTGAAGILVSPPQGASTPATVSGALVENVVIDNADQCVNTPSTTACTAAIGAGDYGESIWLLSVTSSTVENSTFEGGLDGGMLVSDEMGPVRRQHHQQQHGRRQRPRLRHHPGGAQHGRHPGSPADGRAVFTTTRWRTTPPRTTVPPASGCSTRRSTTRSRATPSR